LLTVAVLVATGLAAGLCPQVQAADLSVTADFAITATSVFNDTTSPSSAADQSFSAPVAFNAATSRPSSLGPAGVCNVDQVFQFPSHSVPFNVNFGGEQHDRESSSSSSSSPPFLLWYTPFHERDDWGLTFLGSRRSPRRRRSRTFSVSLEAFAFNVLAAFACVAVTFASIILFLLTSRSDIDVAQRSTMVHVAEPVVSDQQSTFSVFIRMLSGKAKVLDVIPTDDLGAIKERLRVSIHHGVTS
jgi:hypothetical protein